MVGFVDLRSLGYYKVKQGVLQQNLSMPYHLESANTVCDQFNRLINTLKREEEEKEKAIINILGWTIVMREST